MDIRSMVLREANILNSNSFFLLGARQTGKTSLIKARFETQILREYNLFATNEYTRLVANPSLLRDEILALGARPGYVFIDEAQRVPDLLNEVQVLIDQGIPQKFILTGSSARKLKRGKGNLLAGRVWSYNLFPLTFFELANLFDLRKALTFGTLPANFTSVTEIAANENLRAYVDVYLKEEIEAEALSRNIGGFVRFLSVAAQSNGEQLNYSNIARDVHLSDVTIREYFSILEDTLIGSFLMPLSQSERKKHKTSPKFYFFDCGVLRALQKRLSLNIERGTFEFGNYFETWIINEVLRISSYLRKDLSLSFLRTANNVEVDLVITWPNGKVLGVEIKSKEAPIAADFEYGFAALKRLVPNAECLCVCTGTSARKVSGWDVIPYQEFLNQIRAA